MSLFFKSKAIKLDFIIVGTQKGGTSALDYYLGGHKDIVMSSRKEIHFFDNEKIFQKKKVNYALLNGFYPKYEAGKKYGETTPVYMFWDDCISRIHTYNPDIKLIAILRDPVSRAFSHWNMEVSRGKETRSFEQCIQDEKQQIEAGTYQKHRVFSYLARGMYSEQIERMDYYFPEQQLLFIKYERFQKHQADELQKAIAFLGLSTAHYTFQPKEVNKFQYNSVIADSEVELLKEFFAEDISRTEKRLQWDCSDWK